MTQPGPIQPGSGPIKGSGESSDEIKKGKFKEELQKVQKISKTDEDSQAKKKKKQQQGDLEEDTENLPSSDTPPPPQAFSLHETKTTSVYDTQEGSFATKQIDETSPSSHFFKSSSNGPLSAQESSSEEEPQTSSSFVEKNTNSPSYTSSPSSEEASSSEPQTSSNFVEKNTNTPSPSYTSSSSPEESINTQDDSFELKTPSSNGSPSSPNDEKVLEKLKKEIQQLEKQMQALEGKDKDAQIPTLVAKHQALIQKSHFLQERLKKAAPSLQEKKQAPSVIGNKIAFSEEEQKKATPQEKAPLSLSDKNLLEKEQAPLSIDAEAVEKEAFFDKKTPFVNKQSPLSSTAKKELNPDQKVEALLKKQAKEKKKKIETLETDQNTDPSSQQTAQVSLNPLQMAPPMPETPAASGTLSPKMHELFQTMVGLILIKNLKTEGMEGTRTEVTLNNPEYANSPFYNLKIVITEYQTAPGAYNIELQGNSWQNTLIAPNIPNLLNAFVDPRSALPFTVNRLEVTIKKEETEKRVKKVQSTTSGQKDFDDTPG